MQVGQDPASDEDNPPAVGPRRGQTRQRLRVRAAGLRQRPVIVHRHSVEEPGPPGRHAAPAPSPPARLRRHDPTLTDAQYSRQRQKSLPGPARPDQQGRRGVFARRRAIALRSAPNDPGIAPKGLLSVRHEKNPDVELVTIRQAAACTRPRRRTA